MSDLLEFAKAENEQLLARVRDRMAKARAELRQVRAQRAALEVARNDLVGSWQFVAQDAPRRNYRKKEDANSKMTTSSKAYEAPVKKFGSGVGTQVVYFRNDELYLAPKLDVCSLMGVPPGSGSAEMERVLRVLPSPFRRACEPPNFNWKTTDKALVAVVEEEMKSLLGGNNAQEAEQQQQQQQLLRSEHFWRRVHGKVVTQLNSKADAVAPVSGVEWAPFGGFVPPEELRVRFFWLLHQRQSGGGGGDASGAAAALDGAEKNKKQAAAALGDGGEDDFNLADALAKTFAGVYEEEKPKQQQQQQEQQQKQQQQPAAPEDGGAMMMMAAAGPENLLGGEVAPVLVVERPMLDSDDDDDVPQQPQQQDDKEKEEKKAPKLKPDPKAAERERQQQQDERDHRLMRPIFDFLKTHVFRAHLYDVEVKQEVLDGDDEEEDVFDGGGGGAAAAGDKKQNVKNNDDDDDDPFLGVGRDTAIDADAEIKKNEQQQQQPVVVAAIGGGAAPAPAPAPKPKPKTTKEVHRVALSRAARHRTLHRMIERLFDQSAKHRVKRERDIRQHHLKERPQYQPNGFRIDYGNGDNNNNPMVLNDDVDEEGVAKDQQRLQQLASMTAWERAGLIMRLYQRPQYTDEYFHPYMYGDHHQLAHYDAGRDRHLLHHLASEVSLGRAINTRFAARRGNYYWDQHESTYIPPRDSDYWFLLYPAEARFRASAFNPQRGASDAETIARSATGNHGLAEIDPVIDNAERLRASFCRRRQLVKQEVGQEKDNDDEAEAPVPLQQRTVEALTTLLRTGEHGGRRMKVRSDKCAHSWRSSTTSREPVPTAQKLRERIMVPRWW